jgi:hypothetical protein
MKEKIGLFMFFSLLSIARVLGQNNPNETINGTYGSYMDWSTFTEVSLNDDNAFRYINQSELDPSFNHQGIWMVTDKYLIARTTIPHDQCRLNGTLPQTD